MASNVVDDADLYGDLYGADYDEPATTEEENPSPVLHTTSDSKKIEYGASAGTAMANGKTAPHGDVPRTNSTAPTAAPTQQAGNSIATYSSRDGDTSYHPYGGGQPMQQIPAQSRFGPAPGAGAPSNGNVQQSVASYEGPRGSDDGSSVRPSDMRDEGKMFVGGLNWETTTESLQAYFEQFGKVDACTIMRDGAGRSRGFAFLTFEDPASVNAVMVKEHYLDGKIIDPKRAIPRLEHQRTQKLFVGGLAPSVTAETLTSYFSQHGSVIDATVMVDRESGRSKGFGFITFEEGPSFDHLLGHGIVLDGKVIEVKLAQPRHVQQQRQRDGGEGGDQAFGGGAGTGYRMNNNYGGTNATAGVTGSVQTGATTATPPAFDAQAMANLYQRMMSVAQQGGMMGMGMGMGMGMPGMMGMPMMGQMGRGMGMPNGGMNAMGVPMMGGGVGAGRGMMNPAGNAANMGNIPRGPRAAMGGAQGGQQAQQGNRGEGTGPMRSHATRGQNTYHPYGR